MRQTKILFCTTEYVTEKNFGGLAIFTKKITDLLSKKGILCSILIPSDRENIIFKEKKKIYKVKVFTLLMKIIRKFNKNLFFIIQSKIINNFIKKKLQSQYDLIHFTNYQSLPFFYNSKLPTICRLSSLESVWSINNFEKKINTFFEKIALQKMKIIISPSTFLIKELKKKYNLNSFYIPQIIKKIVFKKKKIKKKYILTFGSISHGKGARTILNNICEILKLDKNLYFIWIGQMDKRFRKNGNVFEDELKKYARSKNIIIKDKINQKILMKYVYNAYLILFPSLRDNSPNACLEAMSQKKIVVARDHAGFNDLIINKKNGFLFNENNIIQKIKIILNLSAKKRKSIANAAHETVIKKFSEENFYKIYKKYIKKVNV